MLVLLLQRLPRRRPSELRFTVFAWRGRVAGYWVGIGGAAASIRVDGGREAEDGSEPFLAVLWLLVLG